MTDAHETAEREKNMTLYCYEGGGVMTKVEELREAAINVMGEMDTTSYPELVDSLIAAATAEGFAEGVEDTTANLTLVQDAEVFARGREEGAELERARIRDSNHFVFTGEYYVLPAAVLAPKEEK